MLTQHLPRPPRPNPDLPTALVVSEPLASIGALPLPAAADHSRGPGNLDVHLGAVAPFQHVLGRSENRQRLCPRLHGTPRREILVLRCEDTIDCGGVTPEPRAVVRRNEGL
jgi:hypothetical protein